MSWKMFDYWCSSHGSWEELFDSLEIPTHMPCPVCGDLGAKCLSALYVKQPRIYAERTGLPDDPPPGAISTRHLAE